MATPTAFVSLVVVILACGAVCSAFQTNIPSAKIATGNGAIRMKATSGDIGESSSSSISYKIPDNVVSNNAIAEAAGYPAIILSPFLDAADPTFMAKGPIGGKEFVVSREGGPTKEELTNENLVQIVYRRSNVTDLEVNTLVWKCLGYRFDSEAGEWTSPEVFPKWKERYPTPPDLIGMQRLYTKAIDGELIKNNQRLTVSVPMENKQSLKGFLAAYGFTGYKVSELTPNMTRRAQCTNWLLYYREELFGVTLEELRERRRVKKEKLAEEARIALENDEEKPYRPPLKEVF